MRTKIPAVVVQMSPFTGEVGAAPWGIRKDDLAVVPATQIKAVVELGATPHPSGPVSRLCAPPVSFRKN